MKDVSHAMGKKIPFFLIFMLESAFSFCGHVYLKVNGLSWPSPLLPEII
ncbi:hypothetical protein [Desulfosarcina variabilis]